MRRFLVLACGVLGLALPASAGAAITTTRDASQLTGAMAAPGAQGAISAASFTEIPPTGTPHAIVDGVLGGFPTEGGTFAILSTGDAALADDANTGTGDGADDGGPQGHGDPADPEISPGNAYDTSILRVDFTTPPGTNCLAFGFRFLSEEFPENVGNVVNDGFIAQLDTSSWIAYEDGSISAPGNFAFDDQDAVISVNTSGASAEEASGTTYDGATPLLSAARELTPGAHSLYLSIFDQDDRIFDSAVFVDRLTFLATEPGGCVRGAQADVTAPAISLAVNPNTNAPIFSGSAGNAPGDASTVTVNVFAGAAAAGTPVQTLTTTRSGAAWQVAAATLPDGQYTARAEQADTAGNTGLSAPVTFTAARQQVLGGQEESPVPVLGKSVVAGRVSGTVRVKTRGGRFRRLGAGESIPLGSTVDTTKGKVRITSAAAPGGLTQSALFFQGAFVITQTGGSKPVTQLALSTKLSCASKSTKPSASQSARKKKVRRLWGDGKGRFRTKGRHGAATVRGTKWLTQDSCGSTLVRVKRGTVTVRDFAKKKTVVVKKGKSYVARPGKKKR